MPQHPAKGREETEKRCQELKRRRRGEELDTPEIIAGSRHSRRVAGLARLDPVESLGDDDTVRYGTVGKLTRILGKACCRHGDPALRWNPEGQVWWMEIKLPIGKVLYGEGIHPTRLICTSPLTLQ